jgi:hypothetical protein
VNSDKEYDDESQNHKSQSRGVVPGLYLRIPIHFTDKREQPPVKGQGGSEQCHRRKQQRVLISKIQNDDQQENKNEFHSGDPVNQITDKAMDLGIVL